MNVDHYLSRVGVDPATVERPDRDTLESLQHAHVRSVPFETLAITGDPYDPDHDGRGVSLELPALYEKIVERHRGGFCFELNGLFGWLLAELGYDVERAAAQILDSEGDPGTPANHLVSLVDLDERYAVDVGLGKPKLRQPLPLDGTPHEDEVGIAWRVVESDRPDADYRVETRESGAGGESEESEESDEGDEGDESDWTGRYILDTTPRELSYFEATCEYFATAPESHFTGDPTVVIATVDGHATLTPDEFVRETADGREATAVDAENWSDLLEREFDLAL